MMARSLRRSRSLNHTPNYATLDTYILKSILAVVFTLHHDKVDQLLLREVLSIFFDALGVQGHIRDVFSGFLEVKDRCAAFPGHVFHGVRVNYLSFF